MGVRVSPLALRSPHPALAVKGGGLPTPSGEVPLVVLSRSAHRLLVERKPPSPLASSAAWLGAGVTGGFLCGLLFGGVGGRLAMFVLRLTSAPSLRGIETDDGFTIGVFSTATLFLLGVTSALGILGGLIYLIVRGWLPPRWRVPAMAVFFGTVGSAGVIRPGGRDFTLLSPLPLAIAMFVAIAVGYGVTMPLVVERLLGDDSWVRRTRWGWVVALLPLALGNVFGIAVLAMAAGIRAAIRGAPALVDLWRSPVISWIGRTAVFAVTALKGLTLVRDSVDILS